MKRLSMIFCAMMITVATSAQENIEKLFHDINERNDKNLLTKSHYEDDSDAPTTFCHYTEIMMPEPAFGKLGETFIKTFTNEKEAYTIYTMTPAESDSKKFSVPYGTQNEYSVTFGSHTRHNYLVALFRDKKDSKNRHAYAIVWYGKGENIIVMLYHIYGDDPTKVSTYKNNNLTILGLLALHQQG